MANFRTLDLNLLRVFDAVVTAGSISKGAEALSLTQPAVSNALKRLREAVGEDLLTRSSRGVKPTARGLALAADLRLSLGRLRVFLEADDEPPAQDPRPFKLAMVDATAARLLPSLLARLEAEQAKTTIQVIPPDSRDPSEALVRGDVDVAVGYFRDFISRVQAEGDTSEFRACRLSESRYVCVMRQGHPLADQPLTLDAYCAARHVRVSLSGRSPSHVDQMLMRLHRNRAIALTVNQFFTAARVVAATDLLTVLPAGFLPVTGYARDLVMKELPVPSGGVTVDAVWHVRNDTTPRYQWLRDHLLASAIT